MLFRQLHDERALHSCCCGVGINPVRVADLQQGYEELSHTATCERAHSRTLTLLRVPAAGYNIDHSSKKG